LKSFANVSSGIAGKLAMKTKCEFGRLVVLGLMYASVWLVTIWELFRDRQSSIDGAIAPPSIYIVLAVALVGSGCAFAGLHCCRLMVLPAWVWILLGLVVAVVGNMPAYLLYGLIFRVRA
jgi:hypothetical protein